MPMLPTAFRVASWLRRTRIVHPRGVVMGAVWRPAGGSVLSGSPLLAGPQTALIRLSHSIGLPPRIPEFVGLAIKVLDVHGPGADQDLLLISSGSGVVGRRLFAPTHDLSGTTLSSVLPYEVAGFGRRVLVARARAGTPSVTYAEIIRDPNGHMPVFEVRVGRPDGPLLASVYPGTVAPQELGEALRFDPWHTGEDLQPRGLLNRLRGPTYAASQAGRGAPEAGWRGSGAAARWRPPAPDASPPDGT